MSSQSTFLRLLSAAPAAATVSPNTTARSYVPPIHHSPPILLCGAKHKKLTSDIRIRSTAVSEPVTQEQTNNVLQWHEIVEDDIDEQVAKVCLRDEIKKRVDRIKAMLESMEDGEISISGYDTAWVALVKDVNGSDAPQFPSALQWIANNQLSDGSWGDAHRFNAYDRILNTLACVVALKSWNIHHNKCEAGMKYFKENFSKLEDENAEHMPIGFEIIFPALLDLAEKLEIEVPQDSQRFLKEIYDRRNLKLSKIPKDILHKEPTTLLHNLEGMTDLDWEKLLKLQCKDGSFLFSPSCTAFAFMHTKDQNCLGYLNNIVQKFEGAPGVYPVDLFEHIWAVDRLQRLGISRYFQTQLKESIDYVARFWEEDGICWARDSAVHDVDDTAMGFRMLRLYGHEVSSDVFKHFKKGDSFFCFAGQSTQAVTGMFNLYRASQVLFPGENILEEAKEFSYAFLKETQESEVLDKWIITKDLQGEVNYALDIPWYASLPRVESRFYIEQYGGEDDIWIAKTLYRMPFVNNNEYLDLAKLDYNNCQALHRAEWVNFQRWYEECNLAFFGVSKRALLSAYFVAAASIFEPEKAKERLSWAKTTILLETIQSYFQENGNSILERAAFIQEFKDGFATSSPLNNRKLEENTRHQLVKILLETLNDVSLDIATAYGKNISHDLHNCWEKCLLRWKEDGDISKGEAELIVKTINLTSDNNLDSNEVSSQYEKLYQLTNNICYQLSEHKKNKVFDNKKTTTPEIESEMQELVQIVLKSSDGLDSNMKQIFFTVARSFYYIALSDPGTINYHIARVLFQRVY